MKVVTLGEIMMRINPQGGQLLERQSVCDVYYDGSEANTAAGLASLGISAAFVSKVPKNSYGNAALHALHSAGVDVSHVVRGGERLGCYLMEPGYSLMESKCTYDRAHSAISQAVPEEFRWDEIFAGADWFHFSGITPALGDNVAAICKDACEAAHRAGLIVSCDVNYRSKLWSLEKASEVMSELCRYADVLIVNEDEAKVFGLDVGRDKLISAFEEMTEKLLARYKLKAIVSAARKPLGMNDCAVEAKLWYNGKFFEATYPVYIRDMIGAGDAMAAALIYALYHDFTEPEQAMGGEDIIRFAAMACAMKHAVVGGFSTATPEEILQRLKSAAVGINR